ncbi:radial spoke head protein 6 homolog A [Neocloeon triangulifer]|uniref:radial spoke head protein 6 homolog A n=1 Tax=Neocloeon triangulifer TaxID=2078957 RepID=UPI00286EF019|nr:radial spoke head protein 6 homolog A [Neocloeon triangulifer]
MSILLMEEIEVTEKDVQEAKESLDPKVRELLAKLVERLLTERPDNAYDILELMVASIKNEDEYHNTEPDNFETPNSNLLRSLFHPEKAEERDLNDVWMDKAVNATPWTDCNEQLSLLKRFAGVCIPDETIFLLRLSMRQLQQQFPNIYRLRFWGCFCFKWFVLEAELTPQGYAARDEEIKAAEKAAEEKARTDWEEKKREAEQKGEPLPNPLEPSEPEIPREQSGTGVNSLVYLVSESPGHPESWTWLPDLKPRDIILSRQILQIPEDIVGDVPTSELSKETLLRVQIARINSSTRVAPLGMFKMKKKLAPGEEEEEDEDDDEEEDDEEEDEDDDDEEEEGEVKEARLNAKFSSPPMQQLMDQNKWVHITPFILQGQARVKWWNPNPDAEEEEEEDEDDEDGPKKPGPEKGPKPLSPIGLDKASPELVEGFPTCWALRKVSVLGPPAVVARSLIWPGSISIFASGRLEHIYIGWGIKASSRHFCPKLVPELMPEPEEPILAADPTVQEEKAAEAENEENADDDDDE